LGGSPKPKMPKQTPWAPVISKVNTSIDLDEVARSYFNHGHSIFGPSSSHMWAVCAGSLIPNILAGDDGNVDAAYGTVAHAVSEEWLRSGKRPKHLIGTTQFVAAGDWGFLVKIDDEMMEYVQQSVDRCIMLPGTHLVEIRVDFSRLTPIVGQGGTLDHAALQPGLAIVTDHKYGKGVRVYAKRNYQAMMYALGLLYEWDWMYDFKTFIIRINQPRLEHFDEWVCGRDELLEFAGFIKERAKQAWRLDAPRTPDPKACQFCKVAKTCAANIQMQFRLMADQTAAAFGEVSASKVAEFKDSLTDEFAPFKPSVIDPLTLSTEELAALKPYKGMVERWWKTSDHELLVRAGRGEKVPGYKLVEGKSNRRFINPPAAAEHLIENGCDREDVIEKNIVSPAEAEKLLVKAGHRRRDIPELLEGLVRKPPGKPTLAPLSDKRQELVDLTEIAFSDVSDDSTDETE